MISHAPWSLRPCASGFGFDVLDADGFFVARNLNPDDARAIVAAPELLTAARAALDWMQHFERHASGRIAPAEVAVVLLREAIAKATKGDSS